MCCARCRRDAVALLCVFTKTSYMPAHANCRVAQEAESGVEELEVALDAMAGMRHLFYDRYHVMSSVERRAGGQGVVQFASIANTFDKARLLLVHQKGISMAAGTKLVVLY